MIHVYVGPTPNGRIPLLALEEMGLEYALHDVALFEGAHLQSDFLELNPAAQIPVVVDRDPALETPITVSQTTAILLYLSEKTGGSRKPPTSGEASARSPIWRPIPGP